MRRTVVTLGVVVLFWASLVGAWKIHAINSEYDRNIREQEARERYQKKHPALDDPFLAPPENYKPKSAKHKKTTPTH